MKIIEKPVSSIKPYKKNNKIHTVEQIDHIANSIKEFWFTQPIVIDKNGSIIIGHWRLEWAKKLWLEKVPVVIMEDLTEEQVRKLRILDNKLNESEWDLENLKLELDELPDLNIGDIKLDTSIFDDLFPKEEKKREKPKDVEIVIPKQAKLVKRWDLFQLWNHRLLCWDSTNEKDLEMLMWWETADIMFASPPYNVGKSSPTQNHKNKYLNNSDNMSEDDYTKFLESFTRLALNYCDYVFVNIQSISNNKISLIDYLYKMKTNYADTIIRDKLNSTPATNPNVLNSEFEYVHIFSEKGNRVIGTIPFRWTLKNIVHISKQNKNEYSQVHNATFSIEFAQYFIENFAKGSVLDLFWWTWTSMIVCEQLWKKSFLMELEPLYCEVIIKRFHKENKWANIKCLNREMNIEEILDD